MTRRSPVTVRVVRLADVGPDLVQRWEQLAAAAVEPNPFYEAEPVLAAGRLLEGGSAAALLVAEQDDQLLLALPVVRRRVRAVPVPALVSWQHAYSYAGAPLVRAGSVDDAWAAVSAWAGGGRARWLVLERLPLYGSASAALARWPGATQLEAFDRPVLHRRPEPTYVDGRLSSRHLKALRRQRRRLAETLGGELEVVDVAAAEDLQAGLTGLLEQEAAGWKGRAGTAMADRAGDAEWFRRCATSLHASGRLQLWALRAGGRVAAWQANLLAGDTVFHFKIAYDEELAKTSPGLQLELAMVEEFHRDLRLARVDSCVDPGNRVSAQLYPDRERLVTLAVPLGAGGRAAVAAAAAATRVRDRLREARRAPATADPEPPAG